MRKRGLCCRPVFVRLPVCLSVRPSVCPSVTLAYCIHTAENIVKLLSRPGSLISLVFDTQRWYPIPRESVTQNTRGGKNLQFSTEIAVYPGNGTVVTIAH